MEQLTLHKSLKNDLELKKRELEILKSIPVTESITDDQLKELDEYKLRQVKSLTI